MSTILIVVVLLFGAFCAYKAVMSKSSGKRDDIIMYCSGAVCSLLLSLFIYLFV